MTYREIDIQWKINFAGPSPNNAVSIHEDLSEVYRCAAALNRAAPSYGDAARTAATHMQPDSFSAFMCRNPRFHGLFSRVTAIEPVAVSAQHDLSDVSIKATVSPSLVDELAGRLGPRLAEMLQAARSGTGVTLHLTRGSSYRLFYDHLAVWVEVEGTVAQAEVFAEVLVGALGAGTVRRHTAYVSPVPDFMWSGPGPCDETGQRPLNANAPRKDPEDTPRRRVRLED